MFDRDRFIAECQHASAVAGWPASLRPSLARSPSPARSYGLLVSHAGPA